MANTISPNMNLVIPGVGTESSPTWATDLNSDLSSIDSHNHSNGQGVLIQPNGLNINSNLAFQGNQATGMGAVLFTDQSSLATVNAIYTISGELWYNDPAGPVQITNGGSLAVTGSSISSGTASASFVGGPPATLVVKSSASSGANILMQSAILTNSGNLTNQLTLAAPTLSGSGTETLPPIPGSGQYFMTIASTGAMAAYASIANGISRPNLVAVGQQVSSSCGFFSTTSIAGVAVTNLSVTITTTGRPVRVFLQNDGLGFPSAVGSSSTTNLAVSTFFINRGATGICSERVTTAFSGSGSIGVSVPASSISYLDVVSAGTYTYTVVAASNLTSTTTIATNCVLVAYEL